MIKDNIKKHVFVTDVKLERIQRGNTVGAWAMVLTIIQWGVFYFIVSETGNIIADSIRYGSIANPVNIAGIAAILSVFGYFGHDSSCMLISAAALASIFIYDMTSILITILPIILLCITSVRFRNSLDLSVNDMEIIEPIQKEEK